MKKAKFHPSFIFSLLLMLAFACTSKKADDVTPVTNNNNLCDTTQVSFVKDIKPILEGNCTGCHSGASPAAGINLTNFTTVQVVATSGSLYGAVSHSSGFYPMPKNQGKLAQCSIDKIHRWSQEGAPNN